MHRCKTRTWCLLTHPHLTTTPLLPPTHQPVYFLSTPTLTGPHRIWPLRSSRRTLPPGPSSPLPRPSSAAVTSSRLRTPTRARNIWFTHPRNLFNQCLTVPLVASSHHHHYHHSPQTPSFSSFLWFLMSPSIAINLNSYTLHKSNQPFLNFSLPLLPRKCYFLHTFIYECSFFFLHLQMITFSCWPTY